MASGPGRRATVRSTPAEPRRRTRRVPGASPSPRRARPTPKTPPPLHAAILGCGRVGTALGILLRRRGAARVTALWSRTPSSARRARQAIGAGKVVQDPAAAARLADVVFLTPVDDAIEPLCARVASAGGVVSGSLFVHCSGALTAGVMVSARERGARIGSFHPLQSFASVEEAIELLPGSVCAIEGERAALMHLRRLAVQLGLVPLVVPGARKALYHAAATVVSNSVASVVRLGEELFQRAGLSRTAARDASLPLLRGTVENIARLRLPRALTGPIARGDVAVVKSHLDALRRDAPDLLPAFVALALQTLSVAMEKGTLSSGKRREMLRLLRSATRPTSIRRG